MNRVGLDNLPQATEDEATELMAYHLQLAAIYFQNVPEDIGGVLEEVMRIMVRDDARGIDCPRWLAAEVFIKSLNDSFMTMKADLDMPDNYRPRNHHSLKPPSSTNKRERP